MLSFERRAASVLLATAISSPPLISHSTYTVPPQLCSWESWVFDGDVQDAVWELRQLLLKLEDAKIVKQSPDRRYMRVQFEALDFRGLHIDECQFYLVPTGGQGGAAVVQCRRGDRDNFGGAIVDSGDQDEKRSRRRLRELRKAIGWSVRASGQGDAFKSFSVLEAMFARVPLGEQVRRTPCLWLVACVQGTGGGRRGSAIPGWPCTVVKCVGTLREGR